MRIDSLDAPMTFSELSEHVTHLRKYKKVMFLHGSHGNIWIETGKIQRGKSIFVRNIRLFIRSVVKFREIIDKII